LAPGSEGEAEVDVGLGIVRLELQGLAVLDDRLLQPSLVGQGDAKVDVGPENVRLELQGLAVLGDRLLQLPLEE
jgi:hypothetical protein